MNMFTMKKMIATMAATALLCTAAACGSASSAIPADCVLPTVGNSSSTQQNSNFDGAAIVVANTANSSVPQLSAGAKQLLDQLMHKKIVPTLWSATGTPSPIDASLYKIDKAQNDGNTKSRITENLTRIDTAIQKAPSHDGMSLWKAVVVAHDQLVSSGAKHPLIIAYGSGLDDVGSMNSTHGLFTEQTSDIVKQVKDENPQLSFDGTTFMMIGLGRSEKPQPDVSEYQRGIIVNGWKAVLEAFSAKSVTIDTQPGTTCSINTQYKVVPSKLPAVESKCTGKSIRFTVPSAVLFSANSADLSDGYSVKAALRQPMDILEQNPHTLARVIGHVASDTQNYTPEELQQLSLQRAQAVQGYISANSTIAPSRLSAQGVSDTQQAANDIDKNGNLILSAAALNRRVDVEVTGLTSCPSSNQ